MRMREGVLAATVMASMLLTGCTGGKETTAAEEPVPQRNGLAQSPSTAGAAAAASPSAPAIDPRQELGGIGSAIPIYAGARYRDDLTRRDQVMIRNQYGPNAQVYTLATDDSFPQVYHYYTTYLAQFRAFPAQSPYPPEQQTWRTLEVQLNQAMQDSFIPGESLKADGRQVVLQVAETEAEPRTVIRYIVTPAASANPPGGPSPVATGQGMAR